MARSALPTILFAVFASATAAIYFPINIPSRPANPAEQGVFKDLAVTLPDPTRPLTAPYWFNHLPKTQVEAQQKRWSKNPQALGCADPNKFYVGNRFVPPNEPSIGVLYDSQGIAAGLQAIYDVESLVSGSAHPNCKTLNKYVNDYKFQNQPMINSEVIDGRRKYVLTAYFYDPKTICSSTHNAASVRNNNGFGTALYFQNGPTINTLMVAPTTRPEAAAQNWNNNKCLPLNGYHNFLYSSQWDAKNCTEMVPNWLFYDENNILKGFGFTIPGCDPSPRFQHPPGAIVKYVSGSQCAERVANTVLFSNINVYLGPVRDTLNDCNKGFLDTIQKVFLERVKYVCSLTLLTRAVCSVVGFPSV